MGLITSPSFHGKHISLVVWLQGVVVRLLETNAGHYCTVVFSAQLNGGEVT